MRIHHILAGVAAAGLMAFSPQTQEGQYAEALSRILTEARAGTCSELMAASLQLACQRRIESVAATLERYGPVQSITFVKAEERGHGVVETYEIGFIGGQTMVWVIGGLHGGQFSTAFTENE